MHTILSRNLQVALLVAGVVALSGRCSGGCGGCSAMDPIPGGFPLGERIENGTQARLSESGIQFIEDNAASIVSDLMGGSLTFDIPPSCDAIDQWPVGTVDICGEGDANNCTGDQPPCSIQVDIVGLDLVPQDPPGDVLNVEARMNIVSPTPLKTHDGMSCDIDVDTSQGSRDHVRVQTTVTFSIDSLSRRMAISVADLTIPNGDIENGDIDITGGVSCWLVNTFAKGMIIDQVTSQLNDQVKPMIQDNLCMKCDQGEACPQGSACDGQVCQEDSGEGCVMPFGMEGRLDIGSMLASLAPGKQASLDLSLWAGGYATTNNNGVSIGVMAGARTPEHNDCVPRRDPPDRTPAPVSTVFQGNTRPDDNQPFHVGFGMHKKFLDAVGYALYDSGTLCLDIGPRQSSMLTTSTFQLISASLLDLSHDDEVPIVVAVRPQNPLTFDLSPQVVTQDPGTGEYTIDTPLITVRSTDFAIDFYVLMDYRYVRAFRLLADLAVPVSLVVNDQNQLVPVLGDLRDAFENLRVTDSSLLEEDPVEMATLFPSLLGMAAGMLGSLSPFDLPAMQGFQLVLDDGSITAVDGNTLLAIFANLAYQPVALRNGVARVKTQAEILERHLPPTGSHIRTPAQALVEGPAVTLGLGGLAPDGSSRPLEWQVRVDGGFWSPFTDAPVVLLRRSEFLLQGVHRVEVRGRVKGEPKTLDRNPVALSFRVDTVAPRLTLSRDGSRFLLSGSDNLTPPEGLEQRTRLGSGAFGPWRAGLAPVAIPSGFQGEVTVQVRDEAGNVTSQSDRVVGLYGRVVTPPSSSSCGGCQQSEGATGTALGLIGLLLLGFVRRRRARGGARSGGRKEGADRLRALPFLLAAGLALGSGARCDCGRNTGNDHCPDAGPGDVICSNPELPCVGGELVPTEPVTLDATNNCQPSPVVCECQGGVEPLSPGDFGRFLSLGVRDGRVAISSYSDRFGDLVVSTVVEGDLQPEAVDGVPDGPVTEDPAGYRDGIKSRGDDVGTFTSLAVASDGTLLVSYVDEETGALRFAQGTPGDWAIHEVAPPPAEGAWTYYTALHLRGSDVPAVAYMVTGLPDSNLPGGFVGQLRYALAGSATPSTSGDWTVGVVDEVSIPCAGYCDSGDVCVADSWTCQPEEDTCGGACATGEACVSGACVAILEADSWVDHPEGVGLYVHTGLLSDGSPVLAYHDRTGGLLRLAVGSSSGDASDWTATTLEGDAATDIGLYTSLVVDASDVLHVSYTDAVEDQLLYLQADATGAVLLREVVDDGFRPLGGPSEGHHVVGLDSKLVFDAGGALHVFYQDGTTADLWHGVRQGADSWQIEAMQEGDAGTGFFVDAALDTDGTLWLAQYVYDRSADPLNRLEAWPLP